MKALGKPWLCEALRGAVIVADYYGLFGDLSM